MRPFVRLSGFTALALLLPSTVSAATFTWPGAAPCDASATLQGCVGLVPPGSTVAIATDTPVPETIRLDRQVRLTAASGFAPSIGGLRLGGLGGEASDLLIRGRVAVETGQGMKSAVLRHNTILGSQQTFPRYAVSVTSAVGAPEQPHLELRIEDNAIDTPWVCLDLTGLALLPGTSDVYLSGNEFSCWSKGIDIKIGRRSQRHWITDNGVSAPWGISVTAAALPDADGSLAAAVTDNRIHSRSAYGMQVVVHGTAAPIDLLIERNLFDGGVVGLILDDADSANLTGTVARNVLAFHSWRGIETDGAYNVRIEDNVEFEIHP